MSDSWTHECPTVVHCSVRELDTVVSDYWTLVCPTVGHWDFEFSPRKRRKRARTLATFATRKLLARGLAAATQFASLTRPDRFAAGASCSSVNLTPSAQANLRDTCAEDERSDSEGSNPLAPASRLTAFGVYAQTEGRAHERSEVVSRRREGVYEISLRTIRPLYYRLFCSLF